MGATTTDSQMLEREEQASARLGRWLARFWAVLVYGIIGSSMAELAAGSSSWLASWRLAVTLGLVSAFLVGFHLLSRWDKPAPWQLAASLTLQLAVVVALTTLTDSFVGLGFVLLANAVGVLPPRLWLPALGAIVSVLAVSWGVVARALSGDWATVGRFVFFAAVFTGVFVAIELLAEQRRRISRLAGELVATREALATAERAGVVQEERQRMGREIHDSLAQGFTSIVLHLEAAEQALPPGASVSRSHVDQARQTARTSLEETRRLVWALRPEALECATLPEALERLRAQWAAATGTVAALYITGAPRSLAPDVEATLLRVAQEALANVARHAAATTATLTLSYLPDAVHLDIEDNGCGFDQTARPAPGPSGGHGVGMMHERVQQLGGRLSIVSAPGEGTMVTATVMV